MHSDKTSLLVLLFLYFFLPLYSQEYIYDITYINTDEGLPSEKVLNIIQDQKGFIWVNTPGQISRYDGYTFKSYSASTLKLDRRQQ